MQPRHKRRQRLRQAQISRSVVCLIGDGFEFSVQCLFSPPQLRHPGTQLFQREQRFLLGSDQPLDALAGTRQIALQRLLASFVGTGVLGSREPSLDFRLDEQRAFKELEDFAPYQMIEKILANGRIVTHRTIQMAPPVRADAAVVVDLARARAAGGSAHRVAALAATHQALHDAPLDGSPRRQTFVFLQPLLCQIECGRADHRWHGDFDPFFARALVPGAVTLSEPATQPQLARDSLTLRALGLAEAGQPLVGLIAQHGPHGRALPARDALTGGDALFIESASDGRNAQSLGGVPVIDLAHHHGLVFDDFVVRRSVLRLTHVAVAIGRPTQHIDVPLAGMMALATARALQDLRALILGDHALKLYEQMIFGAVPGRCFDEGRLHAVTCELFHQQNLVGVLAAQAVRRIDEHGLQMTFRRQITNALQSRPLKGRAAIPFVFEDPFSRHVVAVFLRKGDQRCGLTRNRVLLLLLGRGHSGVDRGVLHGVLPQASKLRVCCARDQERAARRLVGVWRGTNDRRCIRDRYRAGHAAYACRRARLTNSVMARVTTSLNVKLWAAAYARNAPMTLPEILKVMGCAGSTTATGRLSWTACSS